MITASQEEGFLTAIERIKTFTRTTTYDKIIDHLLGAYLLFSRATLDQDAARYNQSISDTNAERQNFSGQVRLLD